MSTIIFSHAKSIVNKSQKLAMEYALTQEKLGKDFKDEYNHYYEMCLKQEYTNFDEYMRVAKILHERFESFCPKQSYFITIRPNCDKVQFHQFKDKVESFLERACFLDYTYSFEQKGTSLENLGQGFHVHIVTKARQRSKSEMLRDTLSSWNDWIRKEYIAENCIDVCITKSAPTLIQNYLIDYKSDDGHKQPTQIWDATWRERNNLLAIYRSYSIEEA